MNPKYLDEIVKGYFQKAQIIHFATCDKGKPKVRPVTLFCIEGEFYILTATKEAKVMQIMRNSCYEFSYLIDDNDRVGYIRAEGKAEIILEQNIKKNVADSCFCFNQSWKDLSENNFTLVQLLIEKIEFMPPGYGDVEILRYAGDE